jgi:ATP-dependent DNA ligase
MIAHSRTTRSRTKRQAATPPATPPPLTQPYPPMEAQLVAQVPVGEHWQYEPKWDGFRCLAFRNAAKIELQSKLSQSLTRYFPEVVEAIRSIKAKKFVLDGEVVVFEEGTISFDAMLMRIHPAASRVQKLSIQTPATFIVFDMLQDESGKSLVNLPLEERRERLEHFAKKHLRGDKMIRLSPVARSLDQARKWLAGHSGTDGIVAKDTTMNYRSGERTAMQKIKRIRTADCVIGGFRYGSKSKQIGSLLLGLFDDDGLLHHVGFTSSIKASDRAALTKQMEKLRKPTERGGGFTGRAPGGPSRWSTERSGQWEAVDPKLVIEVQYDHFSGGRFRHGTKFLRWRPDKKARQCTMDQVTATPSAAFGI